MASIHAINVKLFLLRVYNCEPWLFFFFPPSSQRQSKTIKWLFDWLCQSISWLAIKHNELGTMTKNGIDQRNKLFGWMDGWMEGAKDKSMAIEITLWQKYKWIKSWWFGFCRCTAGFIISSSWLMRLQGVCTVALFLCAYLWHDDDEDGSKVTNLMCVWLAVQ